MKRICCLCERWESGGIESFLYNVLMRFELAHMQVDIVAASLGESVFTEPLRQRGIQFYELSGRQRSIWKNYHLFAKLLDQKKYDLVHLNIFHGLSLYYAYLAKQSGVPVRIAHSHNTALRPSMGKPLKLLLHNAAKGLFTNSATELWACSKPAAKFLFSEGALKGKGVQLIPNGIDTRRFRFDAEVRKSIRAQLGLTEKFVVGNVGRLCYQKNQDFLLDIFVELLTQNSESRLLLVGEGEDRDRLVKRADQLGIADKVLFYGVSDCVEQLLWAMDVFAFPSRFEGLGIAAVEAQAAGLPVLSSEYVPDEAFVTPLLRRLELNAGPARWARALLELDCGADKRRMGAEQVGRMGFDINDVSSTIMKYFEHKAGQRQ